jgi:ABC-2 type transport system permease protein
MNLSLSRLLAIARKEALQLRRDPRSLVLAFVLPIFELTFFGYAITLDVDDIPIAVLDQDHTEASRHLIEALSATGYFHVEEWLDRYADVDRHLTRGSVIGALSIPPGFAADLAAGRPAAVQLAVDGSDANTATIALGYAEAIVARHSARIVLQGRTVVPSVTVEPRVWYNPTLESRNMIIPGLIAVIMSIIAALLTALTIAREWERGTMEQLVSTPVHRLEVVLGKLVPYVAIGLIDVAVILPAGLYIFGVPFRGDPLLLFALTLLFLIGALGLGIFISATLRAQVLAMQVGMIATLLPAVLLSGFLFDIASMPTVIRFASYAVPARYYIAITRGIMLKDAGIDVLWVQVVAMTIFAVVGLGLATRNFQKVVA